MKWMDTALSVALVVGIIVFVIWRGTKGGGC